MTTIKNKAKQFNKAMNKFVGVLDNYELLHNSKL